LHHAATEGLGGSCREGTPRLVRHREVIPTGNIAFVGHRPGKLKGHEQWVHHELQEATYRAIARGFRHFTAGGAMGTDTCAGALILATRAGDEAEPLHLTIARPFPSFAAGWSHADLTELERQCSLAHEVVDVNPDPFADWKYQARNSWMVERADAVIAVWDGSTGLTASGVDYAIMRGRMVYRIDPTTHASGWMKGDRIPNVDPRVARVPPFGTALDDLL
jgi:uncharacterized phage-like protein YoqJ